MLPPLRFLLTLIYLSNNKKTSYASGLVFLSIEFANNHQKSDFFIIFVHLESCFERYFKSLKSNQETRKNIVAGLCYSLYERLRHKRWRLLYYSTYINLIQASYYIGLGKYHKD